MSGALSTFDYSLLSMAAYATDNPTGLPANVQLVTTSQALGIGLNDGFSANVYQVNGTYVIAFAGTDGDITTDIFNGWSIGGGGVPPQAYDAAALYYAVKAMPSLPIVATGHSLGGGLAGLLNSLYGVPATVFDNMPYETAASKILYIAQNPSVTTVGQQVLSSFYPDGVSSTQQVNTAGISGEYVQGEFLEGARDALGQTWSPTELVTGSTATNPYGLHLPQLVPIYDFGNSVYSGGDWLYDGNALLNSLLSDTLASNFNLSAIQMREDLAYSGIGQDDAMGDGSQGPNGDVGLMSMFSDVNTIGYVINQQGTGSTFAQSDAAPLTDIAVSYGADLAVNGISDQSKNDGIIRLSQSQNLLGVDTNPSDWQLGQPITSVPAFYSNGLADWIGKQVDLVSQGLTALFGSDNPTVDEVVLDVTSSDVDDSLPSFATQSSGGSDQPLTDVFQDGGGDDTITASPDQTIAVLGDGNDTYFGSANDDLVVAGTGSDAVYLGGGTNVLVGDGGDLTADYRYASGGFTASVGVNVAGFDGAVGSTVYASAGGESDSLFDVTSIKMSNFDDNVSIVGIPDGLTSIDGEGGLNTLDLSQSSLTTLSLGWSPNGWVQTQLAANGSDSASGATPVSVTNFEIYKLPGTVGSVSISDTASGEGAAAIEPIIVEGGAAATTYTLSYDNPNSPVAILGGGGHETINISSASSSDESSGAPIVIYGGAGGAAVNITGSANVQFVQMADPSQLTKMDLLDLGLKYASSASGPLIIMVNSTPADSLDFDGTVLTGGTETYTTVHTDQAGFDYTGLNYQYVYGGPYGSAFYEYGTTATDQVTTYSQSSFSGDAASWASSNGANGPTYTVTPQQLSGSYNPDTLTINGLVNKAAGIQINVVGQPTDYDSVEYHYKIGSGSIFQYANYKGKFSTYGNYYYPSGSPTLGNWTYTGETEQSEPAGPSLLQPNAQAVDVDPADYPILTSPGPDPDSALAVPSPSGSGNNTGSPTPGQPTPSGSQTFYGGSRPTSFSDPSGPTLESGSSGSDAFSYDRGDGQLTVSDSPAPDGSQQSVLSLGPGIAPADLSVTSDSEGGVLLTDGTPGDQVYIADLLDQGSNGAAQYGISQIDFSDGSSWTRQQITQMAATETSGQTALYGGGGDLFDGQGIAKLEQGQGHGDTFLFNQGYGSLEVREVDRSASPDNTLIVGPGIAPSSVSFGVDPGGDLTLYFGGGDQVTLDGQLSQMAGATPGIQSVQFSDGTVWSASDLANKAEEWTGELYASAPGSVIDSNGEAYEVYGKGGGDTFIFNEGYEYLYVSDTQTSGSAPNVLQFGQGVDPSDVSVSSDYQGDVNLTLGDGEEVQLASELDGSPTAAQGVQEVQFADGTTWSDQQLLQYALTGSPSNTYLQGGPNADRIDPGGYASSVSGGGGGDTFIYNRGYGFVDVEESDTSPNPANVLAFGQGISLSDLSITFSSGSVVLGLGGSDEVDLEGELTTGQGVQTITFSDGTVLTQAQLQAEALTGSASNTVLTGTAAPELIDPNGFATSASGGGGGDTFVYNSSYPNLEITEQQAAGGPDNFIAFGAGISASSVAVTSDAAGDMLLSVAGGGTVTVDDELGSTSAEEYGIQGVTFSDGTSWSYQQLISKTISSEVGSSEILGSNGPDLIDPEGVTPLVVGDGGADTFVYNTGYGDLQIRENAGPSQTSQAVVQFGGGATASSVTVSGDASGDILISDGIAGDQVTIDGQLSPAGSPIGEMGVSSVNFNDGSSLSAAQLLQMAATGSAANTSLYGSGGADIIDSKGFADYAQGNGGADTYIYNSGYGPLTINNDGGSSASGVVQLGGGLGEQSLWLDQSGNNLEVEALGSTDVLTIQNWFVSDAYKVQDIVASDGATMAAGSVEQLVAAMAAYEGSNPGFSAASATTMPTDSSVQGAIAAAWHH